MDKKIIKDIESRISYWLDSEKQNASSKEIELLIDRLNKLILRGGKRTRPHLFLMTYEAYGGKDKQKLIDLCVALEFYHQFLLIHDDLIDGDIVRYNGPNITGYYLRDSNLVNKNNAQTMGLLAGDLLFSLSCQIISKDSGVSDNQKVRLIDLLNSTNISAIYGELLDSYNVYKNIDVFNEQRLLLTHSLKSAVYSIELPMQFAVQLLDLDSVEQAKINSFAMSFGILFQLADDYSDYFENRSVFNNHPKYRDFRQGKITYPLYTAFDLAKPKEVKSLKANLGNKQASDRDMKKVVAILEGSGAKKASKDYLIPYFKRTYDSLDQLKIKPGFKQQFKDMVESYRV